MGVGEEVGFAVSVALHYQLLPDLPTEEYDALKADIAKRGVQVPVEVDERGEVLDGHQRKRAWEELRAAGVKVADYPRLIRAGLSEDEKFEHALVLNLQRRHLTAEQRRELTVKLRERGWSTRRIADIQKVSQGTVRNDLESGEQNYSPTAIQGRDGKSYPSHRPTSVLATNRRQEERVVSALTANPDAARGGWSVPVDFKPPYSPPATEHLADDTPLNSQPNPYSAILPGICPNCACEVLIQLAYHPETSTFTAFFIPPEKLDGDWYP